MGWLEEKISETMSHHAGIPTEKQLDFFLEEAMRYKPTGMYHKDWKRENTNALIYSWEYFNEREDIRFPVLAAYESCYKRLYRTPGAYMEECDD